MSTFKKTISADWIIGGILLTIGISGFLHAVWGTWSAGSGEAAKLFVRMIYFVLSTTGLSLIWEKKSAKEGKNDSEPPKMRFSFLFVGMGALCFLLVYNLGLIWGSFLYASSMFGLLTINPKKNYKQIIFPAMGVTMVLWGTFTWFMPILLPHPLFF